VQNLECRTLSAALSLRQSAEEAAAEAEAALPAEPEAGALGTCVLAVRFPDGSRAQRRFAAGAPLAAVRLLCVARQPEAAAGRPFVLSMGVPGARPALAAHRAARMACRASCRPAAGRRPCASLRRLGQRLRC